ncbi:hypothetical protein AC249_AIPGENE3104 [Exaiptasia diaphana]|nr:hypothetical protein AC249_AIPGENE3104 [Exaiptasia diaphana]
MSNRIAFLLLSSAVLIAMCVYQSDAGHTVLPIGKGKRTLPEIIKAKQERVVKNICDAARIIGCSRLKINRCTRKLEI